MDSPQDYDRLAPAEQAVVRESWAQEVDARIDALDFAREWAAIGRAYVELDHNGEVVRRAFAD